MHRVPISLASNYQQENHLSEAHRVLAEVISSAAYTEAIWTEAEGKAPCAQHSTYLNQLVSAETELTADELNCRLKEMEQALGRTPEMRRQGIVPIDLDLLLWDSDRYHQRDWQRSYITRLLPSVPH